MEDVDPAAVAGVVARRQRKKGLCFFHLWFGSKAKCCVPPCTFEMMGKRQSQHSLKLSGCDRVVVKRNISGATFMQMTESNLSVFPCIYVPVISKIQWEINKSEQKKKKSARPKEEQRLQTQMHPQKVFVQEEETWESDELDYENACGQEAEDASTCGLAKQHRQTPNQQNYELPVAGDAVKPPPPRRVRGRDPVCELSPTKPPRPPIHPKMDHNPQKSGKAPAGQHNLQVDRNKKPATPRPRPKGGVITAQDSCSTQIPQSPVPNPTYLADRPARHTAAPLVPTGPAMEDNSATRQREDLDPSWYAGKVTRQEAGDALRQMNEDGAFVVRDSSKVSAEHPYTLVLLHHDKVYNIKICYHGNYYSLGNGLNSTKSFPGVTEMITHHTHTPLLLIDATDRSGKEQPQCCLRRPAAL
ncbi:uncharacterized protein lcp2b [Pholidichthys leucotaenia]